MEKSQHRRLMLEALERDIAQARAATFILGIHVVARDDWPCHRAAEFVGVYLPGELPDLYPGDCENDFCCCTLREMVFEFDETPEAQHLRERLAAGAPK